MSQESPLSEPTFMVLMALADQPRHGYAILKEVASLSKGRVTLSTGTLYGVLQRLVDAGWVRSVKGKTNPSDKRRGTNYELSKKGRLGLNDECDRMRSLSLLGRRQLALGEA